MSVKPTYVCDVCGATRKEANHWFLAWPMPNGCLMIAPWDVPQSTGYHDLPDMKHLCGQVCVHSLVGKWMEQSTKRAAAAPESPVLAPAEASDGENIIPAPTDAPQANPALPVSLARELDFL